MRLLVGFDGSDGGRDALELARVLASGPESSALVVAVPFSRPLPLEESLLPPGEATETEPLFEEAREKLPGLDVETRAYGGPSPAKILTELAEEEGFDAIVVGSPHRGTIGRVLLGSVATSLLNGAPTDVAVAPAGYARSDRGSFGEISIGYDGGPEAKVALRRAEGLAKRFNARLRLLTVITPPVAGQVMVPGSFAPEYPPDPERVVEEGVQSVDPTVAVESIRLDGDPAMELTRECAEGVDLLVVGSRGYGPLARVLLGSVSRKVVQEAPCPILVVRRS